MPINRMIGSNYNNSPSRIIYSDRFIPSRSGSNFAVFDISNSPALLRSTLFGPDTPGTPASRNVFRYKTETKRSLHSLQCLGYDESGPGISHSPVTFLVSDAPGLEDDFYLNLVDWSPNNVLAVGLESCVYFWNACSIKVSKLCDLGIRDSICSVGLDMGCIQLPHCRTMEGHRSRFGVLAWSSSLLSSGSHDKSILHRDMRARDDFASKLVCGLKWSYDERELASVGNENRLHVWNQHSAQPVLKHCEHTASVSATHK
ncbi:hypothetical protein ES288_D06G222700v1 [Gossypium darwinii]|uniref:Anaphase-promoting complex subunit 4 WD40 domain-containing protein n=1 Tax=Gossypium darwinii TaxID=34276 RepID=A0A5D2C8G7_GOSDA|nr:hypothetical protein ES288_D06G222700v1 [Gossypium darwinii]